MVRVADTVKKWSLDGSTTIKDLDNIPTADLYIIGKSKKDLLTKRVRGLEKALAKEPESVSAYGYQKMKTEGIPEISTKMHRNTLKANVLKALRLEAMKTSTVTGAKKIQDRMFRTAVGAPITGKLTKKQRDAVKAFKSDFKNTLSQGDDMLADFWNAFNHYKDKVAYKKYQSKRELDAYTQIYEDARQANKTTLSALRPIIDQVVQDEYTKQQEEEDLLQRQGRRGGFIQND